MPPSLTEARLSLEARQTQDRLAATFAAGMRQV
jgi:hypothetical protein